MASARPLVFLVMEAVGALPREHMPQAHRHVMIVLANYSGDKGIVPSLNNLSSKTGIPKSTLVVLLDELEAAGWIVRHRRWDDEGDPTSTEYEIRLTGDRVGDRKRRVGNRRKTAAAGSPAGGQPSPSGGLPIGGRGSNVVHGLDSGCPGAGQQVVQPVDGGLSMGWTQTTHLNHPSEPPSEPPNPRAHAHAGVWAGEEQGPVTQRSHDTAEQESADPWEPKGASGGELEPAPAAAPAQPATDEPRPAALLPRPALIESPHGFEVPQAQVGLFSRQPEADRARVPKPRRKAATPKGRRPTELTAADGYAQAYAAGQTDASGHPFRPPTAKGAFWPILQTHARVADGQPLTGDALLDWIRASSAEYRRAKGSEAEFQDGFSPTKWGKWLDAGKPGARDKPFLKQPAAPGARMAVVELTPEEYEKECPF